MFPLRRIRISIYFYMDTTSGMSKSQKPNIDSPLRCRPTLSVWGIHQGKGNHSCTDVAAASSPPTASRGCLGSCWCSQGSQRGWRCWKQQDRNRRGIGMGSGRQRYVPCQWGPQWWHRYPLLQLNPPREDGAGERRGGLVPRLNFIHPSTVSQVAFRIRKSKKYIHRCSLVYLLTLCNLFALICFCLSWDFPF